MLLWRMVSGFFYVIGDKIDICLSNRIAEVYFAEIHFGIFVISR